MVGLYKTLTRCTCLLLVTFFISTKAYGQIPIITGISPNKGPVGTIVTVNGSNLISNGNVIGSSVYIGTIRAQQQTTGTSTILTVKIPPGEVNQPLSVNANINGINLKGISSDLFKITFETNRIIDINSFDSQVNFSTGSEPRAVAVGDIDSDGKPEVIVANFGSNTISIFPNTSISGSIGSTSFGARIDIATNGSPNSLSVTDLNLDGKPELIVTTNNNVVSIYRNTFISNNYGGIQFAGNVDFTTGIGPTGIAVADLDIDGKPDLVIANHGDNLGSGSTLSVLQNTSNGSISFSSKVDLLTSSGPISLATVDFDGDGKVDIASANSFSLSLIQNIFTSGTLSSNSFATHIDYSTSQISYGSGIASSDVDGDSKSDLIYTHSDGSLKLFKNSSTSGAFNSNTFSGPINFSTNYMTDGLALADFDGDGNIDVSTGGAGKISVFRNAAITGAISNSSLNSKVDFSSGNCSCSVFLTAADIDGDGKPDLVGANYYNNSISVIRNSSHIINIPSNPAEADANLITQTSFQANWAIDTDASGYYLDVANDINFTNILPNYSGISVSNNFQSITNLTPGTKYYYRVRGFNRLGTSGNSGIITTLTKPAPPTATAATGITQSSFVANWSAVTGATYYSIEISTDGFASILATVPNTGNVTNYSKTGLASSTTYNYRVTAYNATGSSSFSNTISATTTSSGGNVQASNLVASSITSTSITLDFTAGSGSSRLVVVNAGNTSAGNPTNGITYVANANFGSGSALGTGYVVANDTSSTVTVNNLLPGTNYTFQVFEYTGTAGSQVYNITTVGNNPLYNKSTLANSPTAQASGITFSNLGNFSMTVSFANGNGASRLVLAKAGSAVNSTPVNGTTNYVPSLSVGAGSQIGLGNFVIGIGSGPLSISGLTPGTTYYFAVFEFNGSGGSENYNTTLGSGNTASQAALASPPTIQSKQVITNGSVTSTTATISFTNGNGTSHLVVANAGSALAASPVGGITYTSSPVFGSGSAIGTGYVVGTSSGTIVTGLNPATTYYFQVFDYNGTGGTENYLVSTSTGNPLAQTTLTIAPTLNAAASITQTGFTASWGAVTGATNYSLDVSTDNFATTVTGYGNLPVSGITQSVSGLIGGTTYQFRVRANNSTGASANSIALNVLTSPAPPVANQPTTTDQTSLSASWNATPGATAYFLDVSTSNTFSTYLTGYSNLSMGTSLTKPITGLTIGTNYYYRVRASNASGTSASSSVITSPTVPGAPTATNATASSQTGFTANWNSVTGVVANYFIDVASDQNFTSILPNYNNLSVASNATSLAITGLGNGTTYYYRVRAANSGGSSPSSNPISKITAPANPVASAANPIGQKSFTANWTAAIGGVSYAIDVATDTGFGASTILTAYNNLAVTSGTSQSVTGLTEGTTYYYRVRAINDGGTSGNSTTIAVLTVPATVTATQASASAQSGFTANWTAVSGTVANYFIDVASDQNFTFILPNYGNLSVAANATSVAITGLNNGTTYYYRVRSANATGSSPSSNNISKITAPANPVASAANPVGQKSFTANWTAATGGVSYAIDVATDTGFGASTILTAYNNLAVTSGTSQSVTGLTEGTTYYYRVRAINDGGTSGNSTATTVLTLPATVTATPANASTQSGFTANWTAVSGTVANYFIDVASDQNFTSILPNFTNLSIAANATSLAITGLNSGTTYYYRVRSANASGSSPSSNTISQITIPANPVAATSTTIGQKTFTASWAAATGAVSYSVDVATDNSFGSTTILASYNNVAVTAGTSLNVSGLTEGTNYYFRVRGTNDAGTSGNSNTITVLTLPATVTAVTASTPTQTGFTAKWNAVTGTVANYFIDVASDQNFATILTSFNNLAVPSTATSLAITGMNSGTTYYYRVRSANASGSSPSSNTISQITIPANPVASPGSNQTTDSFTAAWQDVTGKDSFELDVSLDNFTTFVKDFQAKQLTGTILQTQVIGLSAATTYQYRVRSKNSAGVSLNSNPVTVITQGVSAATSFPIPFPTGGKLEDFRIVSIPLNTVGSTNLSIDKYETNWRVEHYNNGTGKNDDVKDVSQLQPLQGYWINSNINGTPTLTATGSFIKKDTAITLLPKWNQIGNPFTSSISWSDVLAQNPSVKNIGQLYTYNVPTVSAQQPFQPYDGLLPFGGGFVNNSNTTSIRLKIPSTVKTFNGRVDNKDSTIPNKSLSFNEWFLPLALQVGNRSNSLAGLGMHPEASASFDNFDAIALPRFFTFVDLSSTHNEFFQPNFMKDVVPTASKYTWTFTASTNSDEKHATLSWDNNALGNNAATVILYDVTEGVFMNMKATSTYSFQLANDHTIKFFFSANGDVSPDITGVGTPYPNPSSMQVTIPFVTSEQTTLVQLILYDGFGRPIRQLMNTSVDAGLHEVIWDATDDQGTRAAGGVYFYRFSTSNVPAKSGKIILK